ncbi:MAG: N-acetyltransferase [Alphaproteobacteria bacterium]|nr:N-acetyltransferase [Alphaproteobacteria bacterium]
MTDLPLTVRHETPADAAAIEKLHERAFGPGRYAKTAYRLREGVAPIASLSFVALVGTLVVGSIRLTPITIGQTPALLLGPLAVEQAFSLIGIGMSLIQRAVETAKAEGHQLILLVGDEPYYSRAGFVVMPKGRAEMPGPVDAQRVLVLELVPDALANVAGPVASLRLNAA